MYHLRFFYSHFQNDRIIVPGSSENLYSFSNMLCWHLDSIGTPCDLSGEGPRGE